MVIEVQDQIQIQASKAKKKVPAEVEESKLSSPPRKRTERTRDKISPPLQITVKSEGFLQFPHQSQSFSENEQVEITEVFWCSKKRPAKVSSFLWSQFRTVESEQCHRGLHDCWCWP